MCGFAGIVLKKGEVITSLQKAIHSMSESLSHRGPDAEGFYVEDNFAFAHKRLSIIDLSSSSNQPFLSNDERYILVYNGEIYNYKELRFELMRAAQGQSPYIFKTQSDTEVLLAAYLRWGTECLRYLNGMFAFAIYDKIEKSIFIARDRVGEKPLYFVNTEEGFAFSSELRSLNACGLYDLKLNKEVLHEYFLYQTVHAPNTLLENVYFLEAGHYLIYQNNELREFKWWNPISSANNFQTDEDYTVIKKKIRNLLEDSVSKRMISDVPFGAFLSGGIDSSALVGLMSATSSQKLNTFSVTFNESEFSESHFANLISKKFNTLHHEILLFETDFLNGLPSALHAMDFPSGDGLNTYMVSKATRLSGIKMAISGIGSDEIFAGYNLFTQLYKVETSQWMNYIPRLFRRLVAEVLVLQNKTIPNVKKAELLKSPSINFEYAYPIIRKTMQDAWVRGILGMKMLPLNPVYKIIRNGEFDKVKSKLSKYSLIEMQTYLQNVLLRDNDQMSMAVSLEVRSPFLDHRLIEYVLGVKDNYKYPEYPKKLLVDSLSDLLPKEITHRAKKGFVIPYSNWMRNQLKSFCEHYLELLSKRDEFNRSVIFALWDRFLKGDAEVSWSRIWHLVVLSHWLKENKINE